jgi:hypothetical protein
LLFELAFAMHSSLSHEPYRFTKFPPEFKKTDVSRIQTSMFPRLCACSPGSECLSSDVAITRCEKYAMTKTPCLSAVV